MQEIILASPIEISGFKTEKLNMREPKVRDMLSADKSGEGAAEKEITMFAALCEITPDNVKDLTMKDYAKLQQAYSGFLS